MYVGKGSYQGNEPKIELNRSASTNKDYKNTEDDKNQQRYN